MNFSEALLQGIFSNFSNNYDDNWDYTRYGAEIKGNKSKLKTRIQKLLNGRGYYHESTFQYFISNSLQINKFEYLYNHLESDADKKLLIQVLAYRILGHKKVKLPLNTPQYWEKLKSLESLADNSDSINPNFLHLSLSKINLNKIGYPIVFYFTTGGVMTDFIIKQYEYNKDGVVIKTEKDDVVIDGGGCWGDTALYFANEAGDGGRVFSFEFIPNNLEILEQNISLNQHLRKNIEIVEHPLWDNSSTRLYYKDFGPGSSVSLDAFDGMDGICTTLTIDDMVRQKQLKRLDFIKMDIEGAEANALKGAIQTLKQFKPKLAISLYHSADDFDRIPRMIKEIVPEYKFYFSHCTINREESVLFAKAI